MRYLLVLLALTACAVDRTGTLSEIPIDTGHVAVPGSSLFYEASGAGDLIILLHGGHLDRRMWNAEFDSLRSTHRVLRYDARGYGKSGPQDTTFQAHEDLLMLMDSLRIPRAALIGLSLGGRISMDFALAHPERVTRLILAAPGISGGKWTEDGDSTWLIDARKALATKDSVGLARAWLKSAYINTALRDSARSKWIERVALEQAPFWGGMIRIGDKEAEASPAAAGRLRELAMPILLIVGSADTPFILDVARAIGRDAPNVKRLDLPGIGHMVNLEAPAEFMAAVRDFLRE